MDSALFTESTKSGIMDTRYGHCTGVFHVKSHKHHYKLQLFFFKFVST